MTTFVENDHAMATLHLGNVPEPLKRKLPKRAAPEGLGVPGAEGGGSRTIVDVQPPKTVVHGA